MLVAGPDSHAWADCHELMAYWALSYDVTPKYVRGQMANGKWQMELVHRIWDFASGRLGIKHCLAGICVRIFG